jgi:hypothetical protein
LAGTGISGTAYALEVATLAGTSDVCDLASVKAATEVLGSRPTPVKASEIGEETAPSCYWATANRKKSVKLQIWGSDELHVIGVFDAKTYFEKLEADYRRSSKVIDIAGIVDAFFVETVRPAKKLNFGSVVILRGDRLLIAEYLSVPVEKVIALAKLVAEKL